MAGSQKLPLSLQLGRIQGLGFGLRFRGLWFRGLGFRFLVLEFI